MSDRPPLPPADAEILRSAFDPFHSKTARRLRRWSIGMVSAAIAISFPVGDGDMLRCVGALALMGFSMLAGASIMAAIEEETDHRERGQRGKDDQ